MPLNFEKPAMVSTETMVTPRPTSGGDGVAGPKLENK